MRIGRFYVGIRCSSPELLEAARAALVAHVVDDVQAPANYSLRQAEAAGHFHFLYWGGMVAVRTLGTTRLLRGLLSHLFSHGEPLPGLQRVDVMTLVRDGVAVLAPPVLRHDLARLERPLAQRGFAVLDAPVADVDLGRKELVVPALPTTVDLAPVDALTPGDTTRRPEVVVSPGRYPLACWAFLDTGEPRALGRAEATELALAGFAKLVNLDPQRALLGLGALFASVPAVTVADGSPSDVARALDSLLPTA